MSVELYDSQGTLIRGLCFVGMSGSGKTRVSNMLRQEDWYHYSVDYRIGSRYLYESISNDLKKSLMHNRRWSELLRSDAVSVKPKIGMSNLTILSNYLGKIGDPSKGGLSVDEYLDRQDAHLVAEKQAVLDGADFEVIAREVYGYRNFVYDMSGSFCHLTNPDDINDPFLVRVTSENVLIYLEEADDFKHQLMAAYKRAPKPIYFSRPLFNHYWLEYQQMLHLPVNQIDPEEFFVWAYEKLLDRRLPLYRKMADKWGYAISADEVRRCRTSKEVLECLSLHVSTTSSLKGAVG